MTDEAGNGSRGNGNGRVTGRTIVDRAGPMSSAPG